MATVVLYAITSNGFVFHVGNYTGTIIQDVVSGSEQIKRHFEEYRPKVAAALTSTTDTFVMVIDIANFSPEKILRLQSKQSYSDWVTKRTEALWNQESKTDSTLL